jgi:FkbM family methyltransferase
LAVIGVAQSDVTSATARSARARSCRWALHHATSAAYSEGVISRYLSEDAGNCRSNLGSRTGSFAAARDEARICRVVPVVPPITRRSSDERMRTKAVMLLSGTKFDRAARASYSTLIERLPAAFLPPDQVKARAYDRMTVQIAQRALSAGGNSVDVGAHCGSILKHLVRLSPTGDHWAFEPIPHLAAQLRKKFPNVHVEQMALSDRSGRADLHFIPAAAAYSSLLTRSDIEAGKAVQRLSVDVRRLDAVIPDAVPIAFIKIDVEGAEADVLRGSSETLRRHRPVTVFECDPADLSDCIPPLEDAGLHVSFLADFIRGTTRPLGEVVGLGSERHEYYYVASTAS